MKVGHVEVNYIPIYMTFNEREAEKICALMCRHFNGEFGIGTLSYLISEIDLTEE